MNLNKIRRKLNKLSDKQKKVLFIVAAVVLVAVLLLAGILDNGGIHPAEEHEGETLPYETVQTEQSE